jgi:hypothetical protein
MKGSRNPSMAQQEKRWVAQVGSIGDYMRFVLPALEVGLLVAHSKVYCCSCTCGTVTDRPVATRT